MAINIKELLKKILGKFLNAFYFIINIRWWKDSKINFT